MNPERYRRLDELFRGVMGVPVGVRPAWIEAHCGGDAGLRAELEALLAHDRSPRVSLAGSPGQRLAEAAAVSVPSAGGGEPIPPTVIEGYRFVRPIGVGGMGVVWEAQQHHPPRAVAIKVLRPGLSSSGMLQRFATEIRALARMDHPGLARIHDAGVAEVRGEPHPYLVMELVCGLPLLEWAEKVRLDLRGRCELLARVADAVQGAHAKGVIHRDLKRSNVLVEAGGQPKVLDFGVARLIDGDSAGALGTRATHTGQLVGSLETMSPEQASGRPDAIDVRTDVYSLGCMLYELLTGRPPFDLGGVPLPEAVRRIHEEEPKPLSRLDRRLAGDVETIVAKALAKDPRERYGSASELAADVRRYLDDLPILARPATTLYQLRKFARRHRAQTVGSAIALIGLAVAFVVVAVFASREHDERQRAQRSATELRQQLLQETLNGVREALDGDDPSAARARLDRLPDDSNGWERDWLAGRVATVEGPRLPLRDQIYALARAGSERLAAGTRDTRVHLIDSVQGREPVVFPTRGRVMALAASTDGAYLAVSTAEPWSIGVFHGGAPVRQENLARSGPAAPLAIDPGGAWVAFATAPARLEAWVLPSGETRWERATEGEITALAVDPWRAVLIVATRSAGTGLLAALDPQDSAPLARWAVAGHEVVRLLVPAPGLVAACAGKSILAWRVDEERAPLAIEAEEPLGALEPIAGTMRALGGDAGGHIYEVDLERGAVVRRLRGGFREITALCPLPAEGLVAVGYASGRLEFLDLATGRVVMAHAPVAPYPVYALVAVPERGGIAAAQSSYLRFFPAPRPAFRSLAHGSYVYAAAELAARCLWATTGWDRRVHFWDARGWEARGSFALDERGLDLCADPEGAALLVTTMSGRVACLEIGAGAAPEACVRWTSEPGPASPMGVRMVLLPDDGDGARVARTADSNVLVYRLFDGSLAGLASFTAPVSGLAADAGRGALGALTTTHLNELDLSTLAVRRQVALPGTGTSLAADGCGGWLIGQKDGQLLHLTAGATVPASLGEVDSEIMVLAPSPDHARLATGTRSGSVSLWDAVGWFRLLDLDPHVPTRRQPIYCYVRDLDWSRDGRGLVSSSGDETARVWEPR